MDISICLLFFFNAHLIDNMMRKADAEISTMYVSLITELESLILFSSQRKTKYFSIRTLTIRSSVNLLVISITATYLYPRTKGIY